MPPEDFTSPGRGSRQVTGVASVPGCQCFRGFLAGCWYLPSPYCTSSFPLPMQFLLPPLQSRRQDRQKSSLGASSCFSSSVSASPGLGIEAGPHHRHPRCWIACLLWLPAPQRHFPKGTCTSKVPTGSVCTWSEFGINCSRNTFGLE